MNETTSNRRQPAGTRPFKTPVRRRSKVERYPIMLERRAIILGSVLIRHHICTWREHERQRGADTLRKALLMFGERVPASIEVAQIVGPDRADGPGFGGLGPDRDRAVAGIVAARRGPDVPTSARTATGRLHAAARGASGRQRLPRAPRRNARPFGGLSSAATPVPAMLRAARSGACHGFPRHGEGCTGRDAGQTTPPSR